MRRLWMLLVIGAFGGLAIPVQAQEAAAEARDVVRGWLRVVASGDPDVLGRTTVLPFVYSTTAKVKRCEGRVTAPSALGAWLKCIQKDQVMIGELRGGELIFAGRPNVESKALKKLAASVRGPGQWIEAYVNGDGVVYTFRVLTRGGSVAAFLVDAEFAVGDSRGPRTNR
jgi:hypothetical protein